jgi:hypothetical protein
MDTYGCWMPENQSEQIHSCDVPTSGTKKMSGLLYFNSVFVNLFLTRNF